MEAVKNSRYANVESRLQHVYRRRIDSPLEEPGMTDGFNMYTSADLCYTTADGQGSMMQRPVTLPLLPYMDV